MAAGLVEESVPSWLLGVRDRDQRQNMLRLTFLESYFL